MEQNNQYHWKHKFNMLNYIYVKKIDVSQKQHMMIGNF